MQVSIQTHGHKIDIQTNTVFTPVEVVRYDGKEVSRQTSWFSSKHAFDVVEDGKAVRYQVEIGFNAFSFSSLITVTLYRNSEVVFSLT
jgi:hypothetical protein